MIDRINLLPSPWNIIVWVALAVGILVVAWALSRLNKLVFRHIQKKRQGLHLSLFEHIISALIFIGFIILAVSSFSGVQSVWQTMLGGTAIISAVLAFAAQDIIKDILAGLMISVHKPFDIGDRIMLEDGTSGIVESISLRHVVLLGFNAIRYVIPNSRINVQQLTNFSYDHRCRSVVFRFPVGYNSDMAQVKQVIAAAVEDSEYSLPGLERDGEMRYAPVLFESLSDSALIMNVTVYYPSHIPTEIVIDGINTCVREALLAHRIEIPYNYINVVHAPAPAPRD